MKHLIITVFFILITMTSFSPRQPEGGKKKVLVVSFIEDNFYSDIYSKEEIAKKNNIQKTEVIDLYDQSISTIFSTFSDEEIHYVSCPSEVVNAMRASVNFGSKSIDKNLSAISAEIDNIDQSEFNQFLKSCDTEYVIFINAYRMAWIGDPQYKLENRIHYSVYKLDKEEVFSDVAIFSTPNLLPITKMEKKYMKTVNKISETLVRLES